MNEPIRAALYFRSTTSTESADEELGSLQGIAANRGWAVAATFIDEPTLAPCIRSAQPALNALFAAAARSDFEVVLVVSIDHLGTALRNVIQAVNQLHDFGINIIASEQNIDTTSSAGPAISAVFAALAGCERALHQRRARTSLERARRAGVRIGRPSNLNDSVRGAILALWERDVSIRTICSQLRVGTGTVRKVLQAATSSRGPKAPPSSERGFNTPLEPPGTARNRMPA